MFFSRSIKESVPELIPGWNIWIISAIHTLVDGFSRSYEIRTFGRYLHIALRVHCVDKVGIWIIVLIVVYLIFPKPILSFANTGRPTNYSATNRGSSAAKVVDSYCWFIAGSRESESPRWTKLCSLGERGNVNLGARRKGAWHHIYQSALTGRQVKMSWRLFSWFSLAAPSVGVIHIFLHGLDLKTSWRLELTC